MSQFVIAAKPFGYEMYTSPKCELIRGELTDVRDDAYVFDSKFDCPERKCRAASSTMDFAAPLEKGKSWVFEAVYL